MHIHDLFEEASRLSPWTIQMRRALHRIPENGFSEYKTQAFIAEQLEALSLPFTTERTWIVATIEGGNPGPTIALRAEMDALPVQEPEGVPFRSEHDGWMHACGHDCHMAIQLTAAKMLSAMKDELCGSVRLLFQPAEETVGGALSMVNAGAMMGVDAVYGLHVQPYMTVGQIDTRPGCLNGSTDELRITVRGVSGHAARPEQGVDAIVCAANLIAMLQTVVSRSTSPLMPAVLSLGAIHGGEAANVICDCVEIRGTLRTADPELRSHLKSRIRAICDGVGAASGTSIALTYVAGYDALINTPEETDRVFRLGRALLGDKGVTIRQSPSMGGEDFSFFVEKAPGAFWHLGCSASLPAPTLHSRDFMPDERCLPIGAAMQCALTLDRMGMLDQ